MPQPSWGTVNPYATSRAPWMPGANLPATAASGMGPKAGRFGSVNFPMGMSEGEGGLPGGTNLGSFGPGGWYRASQDPFEAGLRTFSRNMVPGVSLGVDQPEAGSGLQGDMMKKLLTSIPWLGPAIFGPMFAANRATEARNRGESINPQEESWYSRGMTTLGAGLRLAPSGPGVDMARNIYSGIRGLQGAPEFMGTSWQNMFSGVGGMATRGLADRTGLLGDGGFSPMSGGMGGAPSPPGGNLQAIFGGVPSGGENNFAMQGPRDWAQERAG